MTALSIQPTFPTFTDSDGTALDDGYIWIGVAGSEPISTPLTAYWDAALTQVVTQPVRTRGGYPLNAGAIGRLYVNSNYSIKVRNRNGFDLYSSLTATERYSEVVVNTNASQVVYNPAGTGAVATTVQNKLRETVSVKDFGAVGDGVTDDTAAVVLAVASLPSTGGTVLFSPQSTYRLECATADPYGLSPNSIAVLVSNKSNIHFNGQGSKVIQTTSLSNVGVFVFNNSSNCSVNGFNYTGVFTAPSTNSAPLVGIIGTSNGIQVNSNVNGGHSLCMIRSSTGDASGTKPYNIQVKGIANASRYGITAAHADNIQVDLIAYSVTRCLFLNPARNVTGNVVGSLASASGVSIATADGASAERISLNVQFDQCAAAVSIGATADGVAATIKNIEISGSIKTNAISTGVDIQATTAGGLTVYGLDFSMLKIDGMSVNPAFLLKPDGATATYTGIKLPDVYNLGSVEAIKIDNTAGATISNVTKFGGYVSNLAAGAATTCFRIFGGTVSTIELVGVTLDNNKTFGTSLSIETGSGVVVDGCKSNKGISVVGSTNIKPNCLNDHLVDGLFTGYSYTGTLGSGFSVVFRNLFICSSGSPSISAISGGIIGQIINVICDGGTPTFTDGANLLLAGNFIGTVGDVLTLQCIDGTRWAEVSRSLN